MMNMFALVLSCLAKLGDKRQSGGQAQSNHFEEREMLRRPDTDSYWKTIKWHKII
jgi:hypothetical protein